MGRKRKGKNPYGYHNSQFIESARRNDLYFQNWYERLLSLAILRYEWEGLPDSVDVRFLELTLTLQGSAVYFRDEVIGQDLCLQSSNFGRWDIYNVPMQRWAYGANGYRYELSNENSVLIYNNVLRTNMQLPISIYATRLAEIDRTIDVNVNAQKTPVLITCDENEVLTMENLYMEYEGNYPFIFAKKGLNRDSLQALSTQAPFIAAQLHELRTNIWNEFLTLMGYSNVSGQKKERMIKDEVFRGMGGALANRNDGMLMREQAAQRINKMFGTKIEVQFREELPDTLKEMYGVEEFSQEALPYGGGEA